MNRIQYLLTVLSEECNETGQRASKAIRFSLEEVQQGQELTNAERVIYEFNDILAVMEILHSEGVIPGIIDREAIERKKAKIEEFYQYSIKCGTVTGNEVKEEVK